VTDKVKTIDLLAKEASVAKSCRLLGVKRSRYYGIKNRTVTGQICPVTVHVKAAFAASGQTYGSRPLVKALREQGIKVGIYKVRRLMKQNGLKSVWNKKFICTTDSNHNLPVADNILDRQFNPIAPNLIWVSDITYIKTKAGWVYLATVMDLYSRKIIGWAVASHMKAELVCQALEMAINARNPQKGLIVHSDRGVQYASHNHQDLLNNHGFICSMSRKGNCWDNAVIERFFRNLKTERVYRQNYANSFEASRDISDYIMGFYNSVRFNSARLNLSPLEFERRYWKKFKPEIEPRKAA
jgi:putative transposase